MARVGKSLSIVAQPHLIPKDGEPGIIVDPKPFHVVPAARFRSEFVVVFERLPYYRLWNRPTPQEVRLHPSDVAIESVLKSARTLGGGKDFGGGA